MNTFLRNLIFYPEPKTLEAADAPATDPQPIDLAPIAAVIPTPPVAVPTAPVTYDMVIGQVGSTKATVSADTLAVSERKAAFDLANADLASGYATDSAALSATLTSDQTAAAAAEAALKSVVASAGGIAVVNTDGTVTAYEPDGAGGYTTKTLKLSSLTIPTTS